MKTSLVFVPFLFSHLYFSEILMAFFFFGESYELCILFSLVSLLWIQMNFFCFSFSGVPLNVSDILLFSFQKPQWSLTLLHRCSSSLWDFHGKGAHIVSSIFSSLLRIFSNWDQPPLLKHQKDLVDDIESQMQFQAQFISQPEAAPESLYSPVNLRPGSMSC